MKCRPPQLGPTARGPKQGRFPLGHRRWALSSLHLEGTRTAKVPCPEGPRGPPPNRASLPPVPPPRRKRPHSRDTRRQAATQHQARPDLGPLPHRGGGPRPSKTADGLSSLLDRPQGNSPPGPAAISRAGRPSSRSARLQAATRRKEAVWSRARLSPGSQPHGGHGPIRLTRAPPASAAPHLLPTGPQGEPLPGPHSSFVAAQQLRACRSSSGLARHRQGTQHPTGSQGSKPANARTGGDPVRSQRPPAGGSTSSTSESGEIKNVSPKSTGASRYILDPCME
ncbi:hypothetical protein NDU88_011905 [Pleurodeles waltl]|uniref:Uncharacterized protein n=1 Tax=Pleurodeles waltl TaxID=8319 RepID=A0AAV7QYQ1_PLEWA|nr:hypothetical protein NDU88_011905 [Pleurodeles waltl]